MKYHAFIVCLLLFIPLPGADDSLSEQSTFWPDWRGPLKSGEAPHGDPPVEWNEQTNLRWKVEIPGLGHATPIIWKDTIFVLTAIRTDRVGEAPEQEPEPEEVTSRRRRMRIKKPTNIHEFVILALDRKTGKILWQRTACEAVPHEGMHKDSSMASNSPVTDGEHVFAYFGSRGLFCYTMKGELKWKKDFGDMNKANCFGEGSSPELHGDAVVVTWDHEGSSFITALDKKTGKELWKVDRDEGSSWSSPLVVDHGGRTQVIANGTNRIRSYDLADGSVIWECGGMTRNTIPRPVTRDGVVYVMSGFRGNAFVAIPLDKAAGDITGTEAISWRYDNNCSYVPSALLYRNNLYFHKQNTGILSCIDSETGKPHYAGEKLEGIRGIYASPVAAAGRIYFTGRRGNFVVVKDGPEFEVLAKNSLVDSFDASPAIVGNEIYLRGHCYLYCIAPDEKELKEKAR
jgi:outer membrane protein assembly factor BamB